MATAKSATITARIPMSLAKRLEAYAKAAKRTRSWVVEDILDRYVDGEMAIAEAVNEGLRELDAGLGVPHEEAIRHSRSHRYAQAAETQGRMMNPIWAPRAILDMREAWDYIAADNEAAADRILAAIQRTGDQLDIAPKLGRAGRITGTRELVVAGTPYLLIYKVRRSHIEITRVYHGARNWPP